MRRNGIAMADDEQEGVDHVDHVTKTASLVAVTEDSQGLAPQPS